MSYAFPGGRRGFTLAEILIVIVLGTLITGALYKVVVYQQSLYSRERAATYRHDALRLAASVLTADIMEASGSAGDFGTLDADSLTLRSPIGFGIACAVDTLERKIGVFNTEGRYKAADDDSLLIYHPDGWLERVAAVHAPSAEPSLACSYASGPTVEWVLEIDGSIGGVPVGAPIRAFHRYTYRLEQDGSSWRLARFDGDTTHVLAGPFSGDGSGLSFSYFDANGQTTTAPTEVARVDLTLVAVNPATTRRDTLRSSVRPRNQ